MSHEAAGLHPRGTKESTHTQGLILAMMSSSAVKLRMTVSSMIQYVSDAEGHPVSVIVPIELWREIESERETAYLLSSPAMKQRLLEAKNRTDSVSLETVREKLGI